MFAMVAVSGCASSGDTAAGPSRFSNFLVIGVAGNYDSRAQFERVVVSGLRAEGVAARPYHLVAGDNNFSASQVTQFLAFAIDVEPEIGPAVATATIGVLIDRECARRATWACCTPSL